MSRVFSLALAVLFALGGSAAVLSNGRALVRATALLDVQTPSVINEPPIAPHVIAVFPERDFISASGYDPAQGLVTVSVLRRDITGTNLVLISSAQNLTPSDEGLVEVNHPGAACWETVTPNIRPGDIVRVTTASGDADQTTVANVTAERPVQVDATTVVVHGTAQDEFGLPLPRNQLEQRLLNPKRFGNGKRTLRAPGNGTLFYDAPDSINWTATYTNLSAADLTKAMAAESHIVWLGRDLLAATETTTFEIGDIIFGGPQAPCSAPSEDGIEGPPPTPGPVPPAPPFTELHESPVAPHGIFVFPERDFVSVEGYDSTQTVTINVLRKIVTNDGTTTVISFVTVGAAQNLTPDEEGLVEVNHPGAACWEGQTPDIHPGDIVRVTTAAGVAEQTTTADVIGERPVKINPFTVIVHGSAQDAQGNPLPLDQLEHRLLNPLRFSNGKRTLRAPGEGTIDYDAPGSTNWTAIYTNLIAADVAKAVAAESHSIWLGINPALENESTAYEVGSLIFGGTQAPCAVASEPRLTVAANPKSSLSNAPVSVALTASEPEADIYYTTDGNQPTTFSTKYVGPITLDAPTTLKFIAVDHGGTVPQSQVFMETYIIDTVAPSAPTVPDLETASDTGASDTDNITRIAAPTFSGNAEGGATVKLFIDDTQKGSATADSSGTYRIKAGSLADGVHSVTAQAFDFAGNIGGVSAPLSITIDTTAPAAPSTPDLLNGSDTGLSNTDNHTKTSTPTLRGTAEARATVKLFFRNVERENGMAGPNGIYQIKSGALADGVYPVQAKAIDAAGNQSFASGTLTLTVDTANRGVLANPDGGLYGAPVSVSLSGEPGARIYYTLNGSNPTTASPRYTVPINIASTKTLKFMSIDQAGNQSVISTEIYTLAAPNAPTGLVGSSPSQRLVTLRWVDRSTNEERFSVERSTNATTGFAQIGTTGAGVITYRDTTGMRGVTYFYRVRAVNSIGVSNPSNTVSVRVK
ncbi:MAG: Ig-like domain-containing protein [Pyrinomonadaceae bacterium]